MHHDAIGPRQFHVFEPQPVEAEILAGGECRLMLPFELDAQHPGYGLARNMGYGCELHRHALRRMGPTPIHRRTFHGTQAWLFS